MRKLHLIIGTTINKWTILEEVERQKFSGRSYRMVKVKCDCGAEKTLKLSVIMTGQSQSCGYHNIQSIIKRSTKHGLSYSRIHRIWKAMKERCTNPNNSHFKHYGSRGISYDPKWEDFRNFYEDMKEGYSDKLTIDRIDVDGNYCKSNCRWATNSQQQLNKRKIVA